MKREALWDNLKFFLILSVVIHHIMLLFLNSSGSFIKGLYLYSYVYTMPLFIFIAGFFHRDERILSKFYFYMVSGLLLRFLLFTENRILFQRGVLNLGTEFSVPWFMVAMAGFTGLAYMVKDINPRLVLIMTIIIGCFVGYDKNINDFLVLSRIIVFFPFYYLGILVRGNDSLKSLLYSYSVKKRVFSIFILGVLLILCLMFIDSLFVIKPYFSGRYPYSFIFEKNYLNIYIVD